MTDPNKDDEDNDDYLYINDFEDNEDYEDQDVEGYEDQSVEAESGPTLFETAIGISLGLALMGYAYLNNMTYFNFELAIFNNLGIAQMFVQYGLLLLLVPFVCTIAFVVLFRFLKWLISLVL